MRFFCHDPGRDSTCELGGESQEAGAGEQQLREIAAEALGEVYFRDSGRRAHGLEVEFTDVEQLEFDL